MSSQETANDKLLHIGTRRSNTAAIRGIMELNGQGFSIGEERCTNPSFFELFIYVRNEDLEAVRSKIGELGFVEMLKPSEGRKRPTTLKKGMNKPRFKFGPRQTSDQLRP